VAPGLFDLAGITNTWSTRLYGIDRSNFNVLFSISFLGVAVDFRSSERLSDNRKISYGSVRVCIKSLSRKAAWSHSHRGFSPVTQLDSEVTEIV
jgi:hypothetical protein